MPITELCISLCIEAIGSKGGEHALNIMTSYEIK